MESAQLLAQDLPNMSDSRADTSWPKSCIGYNGPMVYHIQSAIDPATGKPINNVQARAEISIFLAAGFETTSTAITWCLALLVRRVLSVILTATMFWTLSGA